MVLRLIEESRQGFMSAFSAGNAKAVASFYAEGGRLLPPNGPMVRGRKGIEEFFKGARAMGMKSIALVPVDIGFDADLAYEVGTYTIELQPKGGEAAKDVGKYVIVLRRQADDSWQIAADIFNSDAPAPGHEPVQKDSPPKAVRRRRRATGS